MLTNTAQYALTVHHHNSTPLTRVQPAHWYLYLFVQSCHLAHECPASIASLRHSEPHAMFYSCPCWSLWDSCWPVPSAFYYHTVEKPNSMFNDNKDHFTLVSKTRSKVYVKLEKAIFPVTKFPITDLWFLGVGVWGFCWFWVFFVLQEEFCFVFKAMCA